jgi:D-glycero-D-manno-heptose 1,7-bisphosphate phosphatase
VSEPDLVIFDADDTLRRTLVDGQPCPHAPGEWELLPGVAMGVHRLLHRRPAVRLGVATNQDHIGYGLLEERAARALLQAMIEAAAGRRIDDGAIAICPHAATAGCGCHKPAPGLLHAVMEHYRVPPVRTLFVGDAPTDQEAALRAGVSFRWAWDFFGPQQ